MAVVSLSKAKVVVIRQKPAPPENVHMMAELVAHICEEARHIEMEAEAVGMGLYHVLPPELVTAMESRKSEAYCDVD